MPDMYLVVGYGDTHALVTKYNPIIQDKSEILNDVTRAGGPNFNELYDGSDTENLIKAITSISGIEQAIIIHGREWLDPGLQDLVAEPVSSPVKIIIIRK